MSKVLFTNLQKHIVYCGALAVPAGATREVEASQIPKQFRPAALNDAVGDISVLSILDQSVAAATLEIVEIFEVEKLQALLDKELASDKPRSTMLETLRAQVSTSLELKQLDAYVEELREYTNEMLEEEKLAFLAINDEAMAGVVGSVIDARAQDD